MGTFADTYRLEAEDAGRAAFFAGRPLSDNPYNDAPRRSAWALGYIRAENERNNLWVTPKQQV